MIQYSPDFVKKYRRNTKATTPILFFHSWKNGRIQQQGYITKLRADGTGRAQLFDWILGEESDCLSFTKAFLETCTFYTTDAEMRAAYHVARDEGKAYRRSGTRGRHGGRRFGRGAGQGCTRRTLRAAA